MNPAAGIAALLVGALILAAFVAVVIGSQEEAVSRSIASWCLPILVTLCLCDLAAHAAWSGPDRPTPALLIFFAALIPGVAAGRLIAKRQWLAHRPPPPRKTAKPDVDPWDDEIA